MRDLESHAETFITEQFSSLGFYDGKGAVGAAETFAARVHDEIGRTCMEQSVDQLPHINEAVHGPDAKRESTGVFNGRLVRLRAMIQDIGETEFYVTCRTSVRPQDGHELRHCGLYADVLRLQPDYQLAESDDNSNLAQRQNFRVIAVPGLSEWADQPKESVNSKLSEIKENQPAEVDGVEKSEIDKWESQKRTRLPLPDSVPPLHRSVSLVQILVYHQPDTLKLNEVYDFVCVLPDSNGSEHTSDDAKSNVAMQKEIFCRFMPRVHALAYRKVEPSLFGQIRDLPGSIAVDIDFVFVGGHLRLTIADEQFSATLLYLKRTLYGDSLAAEYLLLALISSVWKRTGGVAVGKLSVNLRSRALPEDFACTLVKCIREVMPLVHYTPLTLASLNTECWVPRKDYSEERLLSGRLQVPHATVLLVDETKLSDGKLNEQGMKNLTALRSVAAEQKLHYDFQYHTCEFPTDIRIVVVSEGKSLVPCDCDVPLQTADEPSNEPKLPPTVETPNLSEIRSFLSAAAAIASNPSLEMDEGLEKVIENDFVQMRAADQSLTGDCLSRLITCARFECRLRRLSCAASGSQSITAQHWNRAKVLEGLRVQRSK